MKNREKRILEQEQFKNDTYPIKRKYIQPNYLIIASILIVGLFIFRWYFSIHNKLIFFSESTWNGIETVLPLIACIIFLRKKVQILIFKNPNGRFLLIGALWLSLTFSISLTQKFLVEINSYCREVSDVNEIQKYSDAGYYRIEKFNVATYYKGIDIYVYKSGKGRMTEDYLNFNLYGVIPIIGKQNKSKFTYWIGLEFSERIDIELSEDEKEILFSNFKKNCIKDINNYRFSNIYHFEKLPNSTKRDEYFGAVENSIGQKPGENHIILIPKNDIYDNKSMVFLFFMFLPALIGYVILIRTIDNTKYDKEEHYRQLKGIKMNDKNPYNLLYILKPQENHFMTMIFIYLQILFFLIMVFNGVSILFPESSDLLEFGGIRRQEILNGGWWRLFIGSFLNIGVTQLFINIIGLFTAHIEGEVLLGRKYYAITFLVSGIGSGFMSILFYDNSIVTTSTGAIIGLFSSVSVIYLLSNISIKDKLPKVYILGFYFLMCCLYQYKFGQDYATLFGGLLTGAIIGIFLIKTNKDLTLLLRFNPEKSKNIDKVRQ